MPAMLPAAPPCPPRTSCVTPMIRGMHAPGTRVPAVIGPVQWICEGLTPVSVSEHDSYDEFRGPEVSAFASLNEP
jgi:hypothetical protein